MSEYTKDQLLKREYSFFICISNNPTELQPLANFFQNPKAMQQIVKQASKRNISNNKNKLIRKC